MTATSKPSLNVNLREFWETKADIKVLKGGRDSGKTWDVSGRAIALSRQYQLKFLCTRQFQNRIQESVYAVLVVQIERFGLQDEFEILQSEIRHKLTGSRFVFYGIHRNIAEIKGFEGADILWVEEGQGLTESQWEQIEPTIRKEGSETWIVYNPNLVTDFVEKFKHDPENGVIVRHINYDENPYLSGTSKRRIARLKAEDYEKYKHVYLGEPKTDDDMVLIKRSWITESIDAHIKLNIPITGNKRVGYDPSGGGGDASAQCLSHGILYYWIESWHSTEAEILNDCKRVYAKAIEAGAHVTYDSIGVGSHVGAYIEEMNAERKANLIAGSVTHDNFIAGGKVEEPEGYYFETKNKDYFSNIKAQKWTDLADRFRNTYNAITKGEKFEDHELISISSEMPELMAIVEELSTPRKDSDTAGRLKVESKKDLAKREVKSHNLADAFVMASITQTNSSAFDIMQKVLER